MRPRAVYTLVCAVALGLTVAAVYTTLALAGGPPHPDRVVWLDAAALACTHPPVAGDAGPEQPLVHHGVVRQTTFGSAGVPVPTPLPPPLRRDAAAPANPCSWSAGGPFRDANGWWHDVSPVGGPRGSICVWNGPPPLAACLPSILREPRNGYTCERGATYYPSGLGYYWNPERRQ